MASIASASFSEYVVYEDTYRRGRSGPGKKLQGAKSLQFNNQQVLLLPFPHPSLNPYLFLAPIAMGEDGISAGDDYDPKADSRERRRIRYEYRELIAETQSKP